MSNMPPEQTIETNQIAELNIWEVYLNYFADIKSKINELEENFSKKQGKFT